MHNPVYIFFLEMWIIDAYNLRSNEKNKYLKIEKYFLRWLTTANNNSKEKLGHLMKLQMDQKKKKKIVTILFLNLNVLVKKKCIFRVY